MKKVYTLLFFALAALSTTNLFAQNALSFDGVDDQINCGNNAAIQITGNTITLEAWIKVDSWTTNVWEGNIINKEQNTGGNNGYMLRVGDNGKLNMNLGNGSWNELTTQSGTVSLNTWTHVAGTYDGSEMKVYVDGVPVDSMNVSLTISNATAPLFIGAHSVYTRFFIGSIDEVRIWDVARTHAEIAQNQLSTFCGNEPGLLAYYQFNQGVAGGNNAGLTTLTDVLGTSNGTLQNFALSGTSSNWIASPNTFSGSYVNATRKDTICTGETLNFGSQVLSAAGVYTDTIPSSIGCDSIVELTLAVKSLNPTASYVNDTLRINGSYVSYQWIDCNNGHKAIPNAIDSVYVPFVNTRYAAIVSDGQCTDTTNCVDVVIGMSLDESQITSINTYPNPVNDDLFIDLDGVGKIKTLQLGALDGKILLEQKDIHESSTLHLNTSSLAPGVYQLRMVNNKGKQFFSRIIKQ